MAEYIEREAVIDTIYAAFKKHWAIPCSSVDLAVQRDVVHTKNKIYDIPAADVAPVVRGRWVPKRKMYGTPHAKNHTCSECGLATEYLWNYCPNCGARMGGE